MSTPVSAPRTTIAHVPTDSLTHALSFLDARDLATATQVCREWEGLVATPSMQHSELWAALAARAWHAAHRVHAGLTHVSAEDDQPQAQRDDADTPSEDAAGDVALAAMHCRAGEAPPQPQLSPFLPAGVGYRELLHYSTSWPSHIDSSTPAVFCRHVDLHQMLARPVPAASEYAAAVARAAERGRAQLAARAGDASRQSAMREYDSDGNAGETIGSESEGEEDEEEDDAEFETLLADEAAFGEMMRERIGEDLRAYVEDQRVNEAVLRRRQREATRAAELAERRQARAAASVQSAAATSAASPTAVAPAVAAPAEPSTAAPRRRRAVGNGPSPAMTEAETAAIAAAEAQADAASSSSEHGSHAGEGADADDDMADADAEEIDAEEDEDAEIDADDDDNDADADDAEDEDAAEEDEDAEDDEDGDDEDVWDGEHDSDSDDDDLEGSDSEEATRYRSLHEALVSSEIDAQSRVHALFTMAASSISSIPRLTERTRECDELLRSEEATEVFKLLRTNAIRRMEVAQYRERKRTEKMMREATFELGCLAGPVSNRPEDTVEEKSSEDQHLIRFAYGGQRSGGDRSVRADCVFPTRLPHHDMPFTSIAWVPQQRWQEMQALAASAEEKADESSGFVKAGALLQDASSTQSSAAAHKRKLDASAEHSAASASAAPAARARKSRRSDTNAHASSLDSDEEIDATTGASAASSGLPAYVPVARLSLLAYFEILIEKERTDGAPPSRARSRRAAQAEDACVAIGLASSRFPLQGAQPGWDAQSFGMHSDDGSIFHGSGEGRSYCRGGFGVGDVVGCGLDYATGEIFFTRNGVHLGVAFRTAPFERSERARGGTSSASPRSRVQSLYPCVGVDARFDVTINMGDHGPFAFDVLAHERIRMEQWTRAREADHTSEPAAASASSAAVTSCRSLTARLVRDYCAFQGARSRWRKDPRASLNALTRADSQDQTNAKTTDQSSCGIS